MKKGIAFLSKMAMRKNLKNSVLKRL